MDARQSLLTFLAVWALLRCPAAVAAADEQSIPVAIGHSVAALYGPWRFQIGDELAWASPDFDDSSWETVDLTPLPGAHDADVGLTDYVSGWSAKGHRDYLGFAWYRARLVVTAPAATTLALLGPGDVDSAYQIFINGRLAGTAGDFSSPMPTAYSIQPRLFALPALPAAAAGGAPLTLALRVWMGPWEAGDPTAGGIHIAPAIGEIDGIRGRYRLQWLQTVEGYIVEVVEALLFVLLAIMAYCLMPLERAPAAYRWLAAALLLTATFRANQAFFFWAQSESVYDFELMVQVLLLPLILAAWTLTWNAWFEGHRSVAISRAVMVLTGLYIGVAFCTQSRFYDAIPHGVYEALQHTIEAIRLALLLLLSYVCLRGVAQRGRQTWRALPAAGLIAIGLFAQELSALHVPGIWFPFGVGVSRTQFAYLAFDFALFVLLLQRLYAAR